MNDLIRRQDVIKLLIESNLIRSRVLLKLIRLIKILPAQPEQKKGEWMPYLPEGLRYKCSECESRFETPWHYCPACGADMRGEDNERFNQQAGF